MVCAIVGWQYGINYFIFLIAEVSVKTIFIDTMLVFVDTNVSYPYMTHTQSASLIYCNLIVMLLCMC